MSTGVYKASVENNGYTARHALNEAKNAYQCLRDKTTPYATELYALVELHAQVAQVWEKAKEGGRK